MQTKANDLIELIFERLDEFTAIAIASGILGRQMCSPTEDIGVREEEIPCLQLRDQILIERVHLRILRYEGTIFDIELNFTINDIKNDYNANFVEAFQDFANKCANKVGIQSYYAGLEPAADLDTRIFTGNERGPYRMT
ncbi:MAG: hypothetical protein GY845_37530 [Planctomycetes bacterium]|nr:hypothetical protein [Planctomycetota bacterium]